MSDFRGLKGFALARESAFFKLEQEADIQRHRSRLVTQGRIEDIAGGYLMPRRQQTLAESAQAFEVLAEVLQQQLRLDDPTAAQRRNFFRRVKTQLPELTDAELRRYRASLYGIAAVGSLPRVHLGRDKYAGRAGGGLAVPLSPQAREAAQRAFVTGARSLAYGSVLGAAVVLLTVAAAARLMDIGSAEEMRLRAQQLGPESRESLRGWLLPLKTSIQAWLGEPEMTGGASGDSELRRRLSSRFGTAGMDHRRSSRQEDSSW